MERHVLLIVPSVEGEALTLYHGQLRAAAHLIHRDVLAVILVVLHRAVHHGIDLRHGNAQLILLVADGHRQPAGQLGRYVPGNIPQQRLRRVAVPTGVGLPGQSPDIPPHLLRQLAIPLRQHVHGALGIRPVRVQIVGAQIAQRQGVPIGQRVVVDDAVILRPDAARVVIPGNAPRHGFLKARLRVPPIVDDRAILRHCPQHIHIRLQALHALPRRAQCIHIARMIARIHRTGNIGRTRLIDVRPAEPVDIVDQRHGDIAPLRHLPVPLRAAFRDITRKGIAHRHTHRLPVRVQADGIGVCVAVRRIAHLRQPQRVQYAADRRVVAHILRPQGEQLLRVQRPHVLVAGLRQQAHADDGRRDDQQDDSPEGGLLIVEHVLHPFFHSHFAKGQRAHRRHFRLGGAGHQCAGVCGPLGGRGVFQHHFITGALHVAAQQDIRRPEDRVEPVDRQQQKRQRFPHMVPAADMTPFVGEHLGKVLLRHGFRHINAGREHAQHEGRGPVGAAIDIVLYAGGGAEPPAHTQQAEGHVQRHAAHARQPDGGQLIQQRKALCRSGSCHFQALLRRGGNIDLFLLAKLLIGLDGRAFGLLETDGALYCQSGWKQQPQGYQQPQHTHGAAGRTAQQRPHRHHRQRDEARLPGNFQHGGKQTIHFFFSFMAQGITLYAAARFSYVRNSPARSGRSWRGAHRHPLWKVLNFP